MDTLSNINPEVSRRLEIEATIKHLEKVEGDGKRYAEMVVAQLRLVLEQAGGKIGNAAFSCMIRINNPLGPLTDEVLRPVIAALGNGLRDEFSYSRVREVNQSDTAHIAIVPKKWRREVEPRAHQEGDEPTIPVQHDEVREITEQYNQISALTPEPPDEIRQKRVVIDGHAFGQELVTKIFDWLKRDTSLAQVLEHLQLLDDEDNTELQKYSTTELEQTPQQAINTIKQIREAIKNRNISDVTTLMGKLPSIFRDNIHDDIYRLTAEEVIIRSNSEDFPTLMNQIHQLADLNVRCVLNENAERGRVKQIDVEFTELWAAIERVAGSLTEREAEMWANHIPNLGDLKIRLRRWVTKSKWGMRRKVTGLINRYRVTPEKIW